LGFAFQFAWAPGKGLKDKNFTDYWEPATGCSFIPFSALPEEVDWKVLEDGGVIDEESVPEKFKGLCHFCQANVTICA